MFRVICWPVTVIFYEKIATLLYGQDCGPSRKGRQIGKYRGYFRIKSIGNITDAVRRGALRYLTSSHRFRNCAPTNVMIKHALRDACRRILVCYHNLCKGRKRGQSMLSSNMIDTVHLMVINWSNMMHVVSLCVNIRMYVCIMNVRVYECTHACMYLSSYVCISSLDNMCSHLNVFFSMYLWTFVSMCAWMCVYVFWCVFICMRMYFCIHILSFVFVFVRICVYMCVCMHVFAYVCFHRPIQLCKKMILTVQIAFSLPGTYVLTHTYIQVCMCLCMHACMHVCMQ
jgi:hypothetical protein